MKKSEIPKGMWKRRTPEERFWRLVEKTESGCWNWIGSGKHDGRGQLKVNGVHKIASRYSWEIHYGPIPDGLNVLHNCDNPPCVRPDHLFLGTRAMNAGDMVSKSRSAYGERASRTKLTTEQVTEIKKLYQKGKWGSGAVRLGRMFGVSAQSILQIIRGNNWKYHNV